MLEVLCIIIVIITSYYLTKKALNNYLVHLNKKNKFYKAFEVLISLAMGLIMLLSAIMLLSIIKINLSINILNISAIGILVAVLLTVTHNFYLKEEDILKKKYFEKKEFVNIINKMLNKITFEIKRLEEEANNYNKTPMDKVIQDLDFLSIKNSLQSDIKFLYQNGYTLYDNKLLNEVDTKFLAILDLTKYSKTDLLKNYHKNIEVLKEILQKIRGIQSDVEI
jgi:Ni,Fe-hydrogenase I cytochrome b subunit